MLPVSNLSPRFNTVLSYATSGDPLVNAQADGFQAIGVIINGQPLVVGAANNFQVVTAANNAFGIMGNQIQVWAQVQNAVVANIDPLTGAIMTFANL